MSRAAATLYGAVIIGFVLWSYTQVNPNLVLSSNSLYWSVQQFLWQQAAQHRSIVSLSFMCLIALWYLSYTRLVPRTKKQLVVLFCATITIMWFSYPALSNDVFNYLMNGKITVAYQQSPYEYPPMHFQDEPWLAFLHNIHTTEPYGYVWHGIEIAAYWLAHGHLQTGVLILRLVNILSIAAAGWAIHQLTHNLRSAALFMLNPLIIIDGIANIHNDIVMMSLCLISLAVLARAKSTCTKATAIATWAASVLTKTVTVIHPLLVTAHRILIKKWPRLDQYSFVTIGYTLALFFDGAKRFFSWYIIWPFSFVALSKNKAIKQIGVVTTCSALLSYIPFLAIGEYSQVQYTQRLAILCGIPLIYATVLFIRSKANHL